MEDPARTPTTPDPAPLRARLRVPVELLTPRVSAGELDVASTAELAPLEGLLGQAEAQAALQFGVEVRGPGFNLYVAGEKGSGRTTAVRAHLGTAAAARGAPPDWIYVHDFEHSDRPLAISLPAGSGAAAARDLAALAREAQRAIRRSFDSDDHDKRRRAALDDVATRRRAVVEEAGALAKAHDFELEFAPGQLGSHPLVDGEPLSEERFDAMTPDERAALSRRGEEFEVLLGGIARRLRQLDAEEDERGLAFDRDAGRAALAPLLAELTARWAAVPPLVAHLSRVGEHLSEHARLFAPRADVVVEPDAEARPSGGEDAPVDDAQEVLSRVRANVLIDHASSSGAPVVVEPHATPGNLSGRIDYRMTSSGLVADYLQIRAGALHRANGGFLVLRAEDVLQTDGAWAVIKRALTTGEVSLDGAGDEAPLPATALRPRPIPLDVKVVLVGTEGLYQTLYELDPDFRELFKVKVEFEPDLPWSREASRQYAAFLGRCVRDRALLPLDASGITRTIELASRMCGDRGRLSTQLGRVADLVTEASYLAGKAGRAEVGRGDIDAAARAGDARSGLVERRMHTELARGTMLVETRGAVVAQVNGLTVYESGDARFGLPARITATTAPGHGAVLSIEREVELGGPIHSKGVLTLRGFLARVYAGGAPLSLSATLSFEQSYGPIDGDSASLAELLALVSALADAPIDQGLAVTGSIDQRGQVQPVGEVSRKIEGHFRACVAAGLTGAQGVVIPRRNAPNLVLDDAVVDAVARGAFHVLAVDHVDEAIELVTGAPAGVPDDAGDYPPGSVHGRAQARIRRFARQLGGQRAGGSQS